MNIVSRSPEADLVSAAIGGDEAAFDSLVGPLIQPGFKLAAVMLRDREEARDSVQEACVMAWRRLSQLRQEAQLRTWFLSIVANQCRSKVRARWWSVVRLPAIHTLQDRVGGDWDSQLDLDRELRGLPIRQRAALFLFFHEDLPLAEVAKILKVSPQAAKVSGASGGGQSSVEHGGGDPVTNQQRDRIVAAFDRELDQSPFPPELRSQAVSAAVGNRNEPMRPRQQWRRAGSLLPLL